MGYARRMGGFHVTVFYEFVNTPRYISPSEEYDIYGADNIPEDVLNYLKENNWLEAVKHLFGIDLSGLYK